MDTVLNIAQNDAYFPYTLAIGFMLIITLMEVISAFLFGGIFSFIDSMLPDIDVDVDVDVDFGTAFLTWFNIGKVPFLVILVIFLTSFGLSGIALQKFLIESGFNFSPWAISLAPLTVSFFCIHFIGNIIAKIIPKDYTTVVSKDTFIGKHAEISIGSCSKGSPTRAFLTDDHGYRHNVMVEPMNDKDVFSTGQRVLLAEEIESKPHTYRVI